MADESPEPVLCFENVSVHYGDVAAIDDMSFSLVRGETRIVLGEAGSGKTVLLKAAVGLVRADAGRIFVFGRDISTMKEEELFDIRARIGFLFQEGGLFDSLTIDENVSYPLVNQRVRNRPPATEIEQRVRETLRFVELEKTLNQYPSELSGGMRRRVGIARAVVTEPELVLYDSPTAGLDPITANTIMALIVKERDVRDAAAMMATHRYQDGQLMAEFRYNPDSGSLVRASANGSGGNGLKTIFMVLRQGRLVFEGSQEELKASTDAYVMKFVKR